MVRFALETSIFKHEINISSKLLLKMRSVPFLWYEKYLISIYVDKEDMCFEIIQSLWSHKNVVLEIFNWIQILICSIP